MVIWLIGLSAAGKTAIGREVYARMKATNPATVFVDGDEVREVFRHNQGTAPYTLVGRRQNAERMTALCAMLDRQGLDVVCCCLSVFEKTREQNRATFSRYFEVFVDVPLAVLVRRETKGLYAGAFAGTILNVVGMDLPFERPVRPDLVIDNSEDRADLGALAERILAAVEAV